MKESSFLPPQAAWSLLSHTVDLIRSAALLQPVQILHAPAHAVITVHFIESKQASGALCPVLHFAGMRCWSPESLRTSEEV